MQRSAYKNIKQLFKKVRQESYTMRGRFAVYLLSLLCAFASLVMLLLNFTGIINSFDKELRLSLEYELETSKESIVTQMDQLAAYSINMSQQLSTLTENMLEEEHLAWEQLENNPEALAKLQKKVFQTLKNNMHIVPCSGVFYIFNTTANNGMSDKLSHSLYIKFTNIYSENNLYNSLCMFRGIPEIARNEGIALHSMWQLEFRTGKVPELEKLLAGKYTDISQEYLLTAPVPLPDTWEKARFVAVPVVDSSGTTIGVCGFEISNIYFQLTSRLSNKAKNNMFCALLSEQKNFYTGQIAGNKTGYLPPLTNDFTIKQSPSLDIIECAPYTFMGITQNLNIGNSAHVLAMMFPEELYNELLQKSRFKATGIFLIIMLLALGCSMWLSQKYVSPILHDLEQLKTNSGDPRKSNLSEISDLFAFLSEKDAEQEERLRSLNEQKRKMEEDYLHRKEQLQHQAKQAENEYEKAKLELLQQNKNAEEKYLEAKALLERITVRQKLEIDPDSYSMFLNNLHTLTKKERFIFDLYLEGKMAKDILTIADITENTLKYHNKNIYSKLGISSRKELLLYADHMRLQEDGP